MEIDPASLAPARPLVVVGIGASAGGLEAFEVFFSGLPAVDSVAFIVVIHLDPEEESRMAEVLGRIVPLPVHQVVERTAVEAGHVYVIPPNKNLHMEDGHLALAPLEDERMRRRPVDHFFRTLAASYGERAVAVVLSGTGQNGTVGARSVREAGGLVLAQAPEEAPFPEMPRSAAASGVADGVAPAAELAREVIRYAERLARVHLPAEASEGLPDDDVRAVQRVLALLRTRTGHDFAHYKRATVLRRLDRRLHVAGVDSLDAYLAHLRANGAEAQALLDDLLISVTNFFRDRDAFEALERDVIPALFEGRRPGDEVRVWTAGCATGEEAYSVAMLLLEHAADLAEPPAVQVFATDLSAAAVQTAREGLYPASIEADVSAERLRRFFQKEPGGYRVMEDLRDTVLFAPHSLLRDPPFSRVDLVTCRNVLIYLQRGLQNRALDLFHYALRPGGVLFLGTSETTDASTDLFKTLDKTHRIYRRREVEGPVPYVPRALRARPLTPPPAAAEPDDDDAAPSFAELHRRLRAEAAPPSVLVTGNHEVVHLSERADPFLRFGSGEPTRNLLRIVRPELRADVQTALFQAARQPEPVAFGPSRLDLGGEPVDVRVRARAADENGLVQVVFEAAPAAPDVGPGAPEGQREGALAEALQEARERLQLTIEEFETSREEMKAQNEELQSMNEELRSTGEELETAKEEAQSTSEELQTVNDELKAKVDELARAKGDLENLVASTEIATLFLDRQLRIQWSTPHVRERLHVLGADVGRPLADLAPQFGDAGLVAAAETVLERLAVVEREVQGPGGRWFLVHLRPYRTVDDRIGGVVVTFVDITDRKRAEEEIREARVYAESIVETLHEPVLVLHPDLRVRTANQAFYDHFAVHPEGTIGQRVYDLGNGQWDIPELRALLEDVLPDSNIFNDYEVSHDFEDIGHRVMLVNARRLDHVQLILLGIRDVTEEKRAKEALRESEERYRLVVEGAREYAMLALDTDGQITSWNGGAERIFGYPEAEAVGRPCALIFTAEDREAGVPEREAEAALREGRALDERVHVRKDGSRFWASGVMTALHDPDGGPVGFVKVLRDDTERREYEEALLASEARFRATAETVPDLLFTATADGRVDYVNPRFEEATGAPASEALGTPVWPGLVHPDDRDHHEAEWAGARREGRAFEDRHRLRLADGSYCWFLTRAHPVFEAGGGVAKWYGTCTDINRIVEAEAEVQRLNATLEQRVEKRTAQVRELARALTLAEQAERRRIAHVLHDDLQQRLFGLGITLGLLRRQSETGSAAALYVQAKQTLDGATALTRTLSHEMAPALLQGDDLGDLLEWVAGKKREAYGLDVEVEVRGTVSVPEETVRVLLYQILQELLFNVAKHAGSGRARIVAERAGDEVRVTVEDEGSGFDVAALDEVGSQAGLGIASVRERLELVGGSFAVQSSPGAGTQVTLTVPLEGALKMF